MNDQLRREIKVDNLNKKYDKSKNYYILMTHTFSKLEQLALIVHSYICDKELVLLIFDIESLLYLLTFNKVHLTLKYDHC